MNCESESLRKKYISKSNTVNNTKLMILEKIRVICTCSSSPCTASVNIITIEIRVVINFLHGDSVLKIFASFALFYFLDKYIFTVKLAKLC